MKMFQRQVYSKAKQVVIAAAGAELQNASANSPAGPSKRKRKMINCGQHGRSVLHNAQHVGWEVTFRAGSLLGRRPEESLLEVLAEGAEPAPEHAQPDYRGSGLEAKFPARPMHAALLGGFVRCVDASTALATEAQTLELPPDILLAAAEALAGGGQSRTAYKLLSAAVKAVVEARAVGEGIGAQLPAHVTALLAAGLADGCLEETVQDLGKHLGALLDAGAGDEDAAAHATGVGLDLLVLTLTHVQEEELSAHSPDLCVQVLQEVCSWAALLHPWGHETNSPEALLELLASNSAAVVVGTILGEGRIDAAPLAHQVTVWLATSLPQPPEETQPHGETWLTSSTAAAWEAHAAHAALTVEAAVHAMLQLPPGIPKVRSAPRRIDRGRHRKPAGCFF
jgi:hypothetical protein